MMEKYTYNLEGIVQERTDHLVEQKKKIDSLLHRVLPMYLNIFYISFVKKYLELTLKDFHKPSQNNVEDLKMLNIIFTSNTWQLSKHADDRIKNRMR